MTATLGTAPRAIGLAVTVSGPAGEADLVLPGDVALAELLPALSLTYAGATAREVLVVVRPQGVLDPDRSLAEAGVVSGAVVNLFPLDRLPATLRTAPATGPVSHEEPVAPAAPHRPRQAPQRQAACGWLGAHGGAGTSTLAGVFEGADLGTYDPGALPESLGRPVVVVARAHASGLQAAQRLAVRELAPGTGPLAEAVGGLVLVADAPGRVPKALRDLARLVGGGYPRCAFVPWFEGWRLGDDTTPHLSRPLRSLVASLSSIRLA